MTAVPDVSVQVVAEVPLRLGPLAGADQETQVPVKDPSESIP
jgi:hypothetical protein